MCFPRIGGAFVREELGIWCVYRYGYRHVYVEDGILHSVKDDEVWRRRVTRNTLLDFKRAFADKFIGDRKFLIGLKDEFVDSILLWSDGKTVEEITEYCDQFKKARENRKTREAEAARKWKQLREQFDGVVIGIDSQIDVFETGFSIRVLFGSDVGFIGRRKFLAENKMKFLRWVIHELSESKSAKRKIGDVRFYKPVEIVNLRANEVEVKFEVKEMA